MDKIMYQRYLLSLKKQITSTERELLMPREKDFAFTSANISRLLPDIDISQHENMCRDIYYHQGLSAIHEKYPAILENIKIKGHRDFISDRKQPNIFCTYHFGSYRSLVMLLISLDIDFALVIAKDTLKSQKGNFEKTATEIRAKYNIKHHLEFIEAENPTGVISMVKALKKGKSLVFYIDGNTGVGGVGRNDDKLIPVNFLGSKLFARKGIAYLSHKCKIPVIISICNVITEDDIEMVFSEPILPDQGIDTNIFAQNTTQQIYDLFSSFLLKNPAHWEGWMYVHKYLDLEYERAGLLPDIPAEGLKFFANFVFNRKRVIPFSSQDQYFLFDKATYISYPVAEELYTLFKEEKNSPLSTTIFPENVINTLYQKNIIISA